ncbi:MAG: hypothetical protein JWQ49_4380 [Edaphobacter sp.]|nr:hypothetical protein [Edaphobacter sp.]
MSKETLDFLADMGTEFKLLRPIFANRERYCRDVHGFELNYAASYWTPPLAPRTAFDLERGQIEDRLQLPALVSITDHDDIEAPLQLRSASYASRIPISVEWTVPYMNTSFHLGIHNLDSLTARNWMRTFAEFTAAPSAPHLNEILSELHALPSVLIVFNHPAWDLYNVGAERHLHCVNEFLKGSSQFIHALELNGLRSWQENRQALAIAQKWNQLVISGGDRHGVQPNANTNLTHALNFDEFVHEVRHERISHILFMEQYAEPWKYRILQSTLDAIRNYPDFPEGTRNWDDRVFHPDSEGIMRPVSQLWPGDGRAPIFVRYVLGAVRLLGVGPLSSSLRVAWNDRQQLRMTLSNQDA